MRNFEVISPSIVSLKLGGALSTVHTVYKPIFFCKDLFKLFMYRTTFRFSNSSGSLHLKKCRNSSVYSTTILFSWSAHNPSVKNVPPLITSFFVKFWLANSFAHLNNKFIPLDNSNTLHPDHHCLICFF